MSTHTQSAQSPYRRETGRDLAERRMAADGQLHPGKDLAEYFKAYAKEKPEVVALWCFGVGFILGWKLKPW